MAIDDLGDLDDGLWKYDRMFVYPACVATKPWGLDAILVGGPGRICLRILAHNGKWTNEK